MFRPDFNIVFLGGGGGGEGEGGGSILSEPGFRGKYSKIRHTRCIFLDIFAQDCSLVALAPTSLLWLSGRAPGLVTRRSLVELLLGEFRLFISEPPVSLTEKTTFSIVDLQWNLP